MYRLSFAEKTPLYMLLGISLSLVLVYSFIEITAFAADSCAGNCGGACGTTGSAERSHRQLLMLVSSAVICGMIFGIEFGALNVESDTYSSDQGLKILIATTVPIGFLLGAATAVIDERLTDTDSAAVSTARQSLIRNDL